MISQTNKQTERTGYPSIDKPWLKYYSEAAIRVSPPKCTIYDNIYNSNRDYQDDIALIYFGKKITYRHLFTQVDKTAKALAACGVKRGDNVALCMPAVPEAIYAILACNKMGANVNMLNPTFTEEQLAARINETGAELMIVLNELYDCVQNVIPNTQIKTVVTCPAVNALGTVVKIIKKVRKIENTVTWNEFVSQAKGVTYEIPQFQSQVPAIMVYSSGTTGASKGIQLTNDSINAAISECDSGVYGFKRQDRYFAQVPIWFSTGIVVTMLSPLKYGVTVILEPIYDFNIFYKHILKFKPNFMITANGLVDFLMTKQPVMPAVKSFKFLCIGGEYVSPSAEEKCNKWMKRNGNVYGLQKGYGMCECGGVVTNTITSCNVVGSAGIPLPHVTVSAFDLESGEELKYGERGEIRVLTPCRMSGYFNKPDETAKRLHTDVAGNVWVCTGDMGYVKEDGNVYISGRISDSYVGERGKIIYLFDVERAILDVWQVRQCKAVVSEIDGEQVHVCHLVLEDGADKEETLAQIRWHCSEALEEHCQPRWFKFYEDALPMAPSGKLDVAQMQDDIKGIVEGKSQRSS